MRRLQLPAAVAAICALTVLGMVVFDPSAPAKRDQSIVRARAIALVGPDGRTRAEIGVEDNGEVVFRLRDQDGRIRVKLGADRTGSGLLLLDERTEPGVHLRAGERQTSLSLTRGDERTELAP
jgi:hypothetical protein